MSLRERLAETIRLNGPLTVAQYMTACLHDPQEGYYAVRPALGAAGDFITAPLVSQMFGELIGVWLVATWRRMGAPDRFQLVEMGPGDGTLMADVLRAARIDPDFLAAATIAFVDRPGPLAEARQARLPQARAALDLDEVPEAPLLLIGNEVLDCLPAQQFIRTAEGWVERRIGLTEDLNLTFGSAPTSFAGPPDTAEGLIVESSPAQAAMGGRIGERLARQTGAALLIDYGRAEPGPGDTLQAVRGHERVDPLACPGEADLTVHVDFPAVAAAARDAGALAWPLLTQGELLRQLGVEARAEALSRAQPDHAATLARQLQRLIAPDQMGELFKALCLTSPGLSPPIFEAA